MQNPNGEVEALHLVQHQDKSLHPISDEIERWRVILAVPYQEYVLV